MKVLSRLLSGIQRLFQHKVPKHRALYAVTGGTYLGEFFVFMEQCKDTYMFLSLPDMKIRIVSVEKFKFGIENKILDPAGKVSRDIHEVCVAQYRKNASKA